MGILSWTKERSVTRPDVRLSAARAAARVARGAAYLDEADPLWYFRIDRDTLDLNHPGCCVLGQLHGDYRAGLFRADIVNAKSSVRASLSPVAMGFQAIDFSDESKKELDYDHLTSAWREEIAQRLLTDSPPESVAAAAAGDTAPTSEETQYV